jgi:putative methionine-R-sulfoxide reductase with GAF domain
VDARKHELYWDTALGPSGAELKESFRLPLDDQSIAGRVALTCRSMLVNDVERSPYHFKKADQKTHFKTRNMVCVPVVSKGNIIGVLQAINKDNGDFEAEDLG